ncbi:universal stress protein [Streptomyces sp. NPDC050856]|uniref:universal stress protein n=1 Tax=Streptomyces sp. NPDC050856 TaxID=3154939 RepID=UPI00340964D0
MAAGRIVVGVDGSEPSLGALRWAARQAELTGDRLEAVIGWEYPASGWAAMAPGMPLAAMPSGAAAEADPEELARRTLDEAVTATLGGAAAAATDRLVVNGHAAQALVERAAGASLLVVGDRGHSGLTAALLGSVSRHVTHHAPCPVVVVRGDTG